MQTIVTDAKKQTAVPVVVANQRVESFLSQSLLADG